MSSLDKLMKAFESVRIASSGNQATGAKLKRSGSESSANVPQLDSSSSLQEARSILEQPKTMASFASSISQQGQNLLSKKDQPLTSRDKLSLCHSVVESVISGTKSGTTDLQKLISIGIETLIVLIDDENPDVRMNADEALNRVIRCLSENHMGKVQLELFKEIKKNGSVRCLRAALLRFGILCHHIRPQKCRAYIQNLLPYLSITAKRPEENLQETLTQCLEKILPILGHFTNDNEVKSLLSAFLPNVSHSSPSMRRSACSSLVLLCQHSRKPDFFILWLLDTAIQILLPQQSNLPTSNQILGGLLLIRYLTAHFEQLTTATNNSQLYLDKGGTKGREVAMSYDQSLQVYEICLHYCGARENSIITASLEALQSLLQNSSQYLLVALTSPEGITRSRICGEQTKNLMSRTTSQVSIAASLQEEESLESMELSSHIQMCQDDEVGNFDQGTTFIRPTVITSTERVLTKSLSCDAAEAGQSSYVASGSQSGHAEAGNSAADLGDASLPSEHEFSEHRSNIYTEIEIGQVSDTGVLLGRSDLDIGSNSGAERIKKKRHSLDDSEVKHPTKGKLVSEDRVKVQGNIGSFFDEDLPVKYLVRYLCSSFLLSGRPGTLISNQTAKVSMKALALNCVGYALSLQPSLMGDTLFISGASEDILEQQYISDILLYHLHVDPQMGAGIAVVIGQFIYSQLINAEGRYSDLDRGCLQLETLLKLLCKLLQHHSSVTVRGALASLNICLPELLHSWHAVTALPVIYQLMETTSNPYWLVKVELCDLLSRLSLHNIDHLENKGLKIRIHPSQSDTVFRNANRFSHNILSTVFIPLLREQDMRVRTAASISISRLIPELMSEGDLVLSSSCNLSKSGLFKVSSAMDVYRPLSVCPEGSVSLVPPFHKLIDSEVINLMSEPQKYSSLKHLRWKNIEESLSRVVNVFAVKLLSCNEKYMRLGCLEVLSRLCYNYPPVQYPKSWGCHIVTSPGTGHEKGHQLCLVTLLLSLAGESMLAGDLSSQQCILNISSNWLAGRTVFLSEHSHNETRDDKQLWACLQHSQLSSVAENLVQHMLRILCVYMHLLEGITPSTRTTLVTSGPAAALSPIKRKTRADSVGEKHKPPSSVLSEKSEREEKEKKSKSGVRGSFVHLPEYIKLYDVLKSAYTNYKMSLEESAKSKFSDLLDSTLTTLGILLELASVNEFGRLAEELLQYLKFTASILSTRTIFCGQQLLKCLFGSNVIAQWDQLFPSPNPSLTASLPLSSTLSASFTSSFRSEFTTDEQQLPTLYSVAFHIPSSQLKKDLNSLLEGKMELDTLSLGILKKRVNSGSLRPQSKATDKSSLSSYIRLFEPLVIKALKLYTVSSDVIMQRSVLELLIHLVQIRVNYCLLDSEQIFIGYVIKQFEYIEEGHIKNAEELIPSMFNFLVLLSYERHHSKSIIGVPKIIQLCDGLMASGQPPLSHCVLALKPLVEDLFLERSHSSASDQKELETQKEVICSMLLRLAQYHQVLHLLSIVLISTHETNKDRWRKLSRQILDTLLPMISKLQINIDSKKALSSLEEVLNRVCPSVFRPPDPVLKALLTSPCEIETTEGVERWVGGVMLLLRVLISRTTIDMMLARLEQLGLCMDYVRADGDSMMTSSLHQSLSPKRYGPRKENMDSHPSFIDPLNVIQPSVQPQMALARFLLEVARVGASELKTIEFIKLQSQFYSHNQKTSPQFLAHLTSHLLLTLIYLIDTGQWEPVMTTFRQLIYSENGIVEEVSEAFLFTSRWHPSLAILWCKLLGRLDYPSQALWNKVLRTVQRKSVGTPSLENSPVEGSNLSGCLSLEFLRRAGFLVFCEFVLRHSQEGEWLTWLVVQHINDIVLMYQEPPVQSLLQAIYASSAASSLLIQAFHARCKCVHKAEYGSNIISIISGIHVGQSGALIVFLIDRMISSPFLVISRSVATLCSQRLHYMLANADNTLQLNVNDIKKLIATMKIEGMNKRYGQVYSLLHQLLALQQNEGSLASPHETSSLSTPSSTLLDLNWYLQLVKSRCCVGNGGSRECSELLSHLEYNDVLMIMSSKHFSLEILPQAFQKSLTVTMQAHSNWIESSSCSVDTGESSDGSSIIEGSEAPLLSACKVILLQHVAKVVSALPRPHMVFVTQESNKYSEKLNKILSNDDTFVKLVETLAPSVTELVCSYVTLPWKTEIDSSTLETLASFAVLNMELVHRLAYEKTLSVTIASKCLTCVDFVLRRCDIFSLICSVDKTSYVCSMVSSLHMVIEHWITPQVLPSLPPSLEESLEGGTDTPQIACLRLMQLMLWLENQGHRDLPPSLAQPFRSIFIALGRIPTLNSVVRTPPELWTMEWSPALISETPVLSFPPIPSDLLQEADILKQFIFRISLLGFTGRQQFEETWMQFLSVLNATPNAETPTDEIPYINLSLSLAIRGVTSLLVQTMLMPNPGNTHNSVLLHLPRDKPPCYLTSKGGQKLQKIMQLLHYQLKEVQHIIRGGPKRPSYHTGQVSVDFLAAAVSSGSTLRTDAESNGCYEFDLRTGQLEKCGLDVQSCIHFLHYLYSSWLSPQSGLCSSVVSEVVKSLSILCDLFTSASHHRWILETLVPLHSTHPVEDYITTQYIVLATCKTLATLKAAQQEVSSSLAEGVLHILEAALRSIQVSVRTCALQGILYLLQAPQEDASPIINTAADYILKYNNDGKSTECENHEVAVWEVWVYLVERFKSLPDPTLPTTALHMALSTAASTSTSPRILHQVLRGVERLILVQQLSTGTVEVVLKLVMDLVLNSPPAVSLASLPLFITALHSSTRVQEDGFPEHYREDFSHPEDVGSDPEMLLQFMEKLSILFDRIRIGYPYEAGVLAGLLGPCLLDILPASQILNKVITEYISSHQPHPHLLASTLFEVFEAAINEGGENLVQEWVLLSLSNFTQRAPVSLAVWCLTCFFIAASNDRWLRVAFPSVKARLGKLDASDIQIFCLAATHFRRSLATDHQRLKFDDVFHGAASLGLPFEELLHCLNEEKKKETE